MRKINEQIKGTSFMVQEFFFTYIVLFSNLLVYSRFISSSAAEEPRYLLVRELKL